MPKDVTESNSTIIMNLILLPIRLLWDAIVIIAAIWLEILWVGFLFGSVLGVVLVLIFAPELFLAPLGLLNFLVPLWSDEHS